LTVGCFPCHPSSTVSNLIVPSNECHQKQTSTKPDGSKASFPSFARPVHLSSSHRSPLPNSELPKGLGDNPFIRMVCALFSPYQPANLLHSTSLNKNSDANAGPAHVPSPSSAGTPVPACDSKRQSYAKPAPKPATSARPVSSTSSTIFLRRCAIRRWGSRMRPRRAISIVSIMRRTRRLRFVRPSLHHVCIFFDARRSLRGVRIS
jgi:hypothetical protein